MSPHNRAILEQMAAELASTNQAWIIGTDANMPPEELENSGWLELVNGKIVAPQLATCGSEVFDYFIVSKQLERAVHGVQVLEDAGTYPHSPVRLLLRAGIARRHCRTLRRPPPIPGRLPMGPYDEDTHQLFAHGDIDGATTAMPRHAATDIDQSAELWVHQSRSTFARIMGRNLGDSDEARFNWSQDDPSRGRSSPTTIDAAAQWRSVGNSAHHVASGIRRCKKGLQCSPPVSTRIWKLHQLASRLLGPKENILLDDEKCKWINDLVWLYNEAPTAEQIQPAELTKLAARAFKTAQALDEIAAKERRAAFH